MDDIKSVVAAMNDGAVTVEEVKHSRIGASGANRWMACAGSVRLTASLGEKALDAGMAAAQGTAAHALGAACLIENREAWEFAGQVIKSRQWSFEVDQEMVASVQVYVDFVRGKMAQYKDAGAVLLIEHPMQSMLDPEAFGTGDAVIYVPDDRIIIADYKHGIGITCEPDKEQTKIYGYFACEDVPAHVKIDLAKIKVVELYIVQPRIPHPEGEIRRHVTNPTELTDWFTSEVLPAMAETRNPRSNLTVGDHCKFCPAREACPAILAEVQAVAVGRPLSALTSDELSGIMRKAAAIKKYLDDADAEGFRRALQGDAIAGFKLVRQKSNRVWKDTIDILAEDGTKRTVSVEEVIKNRFGVDAYSAPSLLGPAPIEKLPGGKEIVTRCAYKPDKGLTLAPESDKREAVKRTVEHAIESGVNQTV